MLNGKLVSLRAVEKEDAEHIRDWLTDTDLLHMLGARPIPLGSALDPEKLPELFRMRDGRVLAVLSRDKSLIGLVAVGNFHEFNRTASIMALIGERSEWNRGYGSDAVRTVTAFVFHDLNLNCLEAIVPDFNTRALRMFQSVGYETEGTLRNRFFGRGRYWNMVAMSAVRDGWHPDVSNVQAPTEVGMESPNPVAEAQRPPVTPEPNAVPIGQGAAPDSAGSASALPTDRPAL